MINKLVLLEKYMKNVCYLKKKEVNQKEII
jgi:hypothetical protein